MPSKTIYPRNAGKDSFPLMPTVHLTWGRDSGDVQLGLSTPEQPNEPGTGQHHLVDYWYGDVVTLAAIGQNLVDRLSQEGVAVTWTLSPQILGRLVLDAVTGSSPVGGTSWWTDLDRFGLNALIRFARTARDAAFGRDE